MKKQMLIITGRLPGRNEAENAARTSWATGANLKKTNTERVYWECKAQRLEPVKGMAHITVTFYEKDYRRDTDNILGGLKYILDGLVNAGIIVDDGRKYVDLSVNPVMVDKKNPRIEVEIEETIRKENKL